MLRTKMTITLNWKWWTLIVVFVAYTIIARYCAFKLAVGLASCACTG
jgi:hypothetical protein